MYRPLNNENEKLTQLSSGCEIAFGAIYNHYSPCLYKKITHIIKDEIIAQEIVQEVFIIVWEKRASIDTSKCFSAYLSCIVTNKCYDYFRRCSKERKLTSKLNEHAEYLSIEEKLINKENSLLLTKVIQLLPPKRRLIFSLCKLEGKTYDDVSQQLGVSSSTISDHIVKANQFIKMKLLPAFT